MSICEHWKENCGGTMHVATCVQYKYLLPISLYANSQTIKQMRSDWVALKSGGGLIYIYTYKYISVFSLRAGHKKPYKWGKKDLYLIASHSQLSWSRLPTELCWRTLLMMMMLMRPAVCRVIRLNAWVRIYLRLVFARAHAT